MRHVVVGIREPERRQHQRRVERRQRRDESVGDSFRRDRAVTREVGVFDEVEMHGNCIDNRERAAVLPSARLHDVVARREPALHVPQSHRLGVRDGIACEHRDDGDAAVHRHEARAAEDGIVEVRRHDHHPVELTRVGQAPRAHGEGGIANGFRTRRGHAVSSSGSSACAARGIPRNDLRTPRGSRDRACRSR